MLPFLPRSVKRNIVEESDVFVLEVSSYKALYILHVRFRHVIYLMYLQVEQLNLLSDSNKLLREQKNKLDQLLETTQSRVQELEGEIQPLKESVKTLTVQKDALVAEKTALKNEV